MEESNKNSESLPNIENKNKLPIKKVHKSLNFTANDFLYIQQLINQSENIKKKSNNAKRNSIRYSISNNTLERHIASQKNNDIMKNNLKRKQSLQIPNSNFLYFQKNFGLNVPKNSYSQNMKLAPNITTLSRDFTNNNNFTSREKISSALLNNRQTPLSNKSNYSFTIQRLYNQVKSRNRDEKRLSHTTLFNEDSKKDSQKFQSYSRRNTLSRAQQYNTNYPYGIYHRAVSLSQAKNKNPLSKKTTYRQNKRKNSVIVNPLLISDEDKIFDEMKKYLCFKYEQKELEKQNENKKDLDKTKATSLKSKKLKPKLLTSEQDKLDYLYLRTNMTNKKIRIIKRKKEKQNLVEYQNNLLEAIKPTISEYRYIFLKNKLFDIRLKDCKKYQNNYKKLKEIENQEEDIINDFNNTCKKCVKTFRQVRTNKEMVRSTNLKIKLPFINFISCLKRRRNKAKKK